MADDPKLIKIARALYAEQQRAKAEGKELSPEWADWFVGQQSGGSIAGADVVKYLEGLQQQRVPAYTSVGRHGGRVTTTSTRPAMRDIGRSMAQGALFNWADELVGLFKGEGAKEEMRLREDMSTQTRGEKIMAGLLGGAPLAAIPGGALMTGATTVPRAVATGAAVGGASGALAGAGAGEDANSRAAGAVFGGTIGMGTGAVIPTVPATVNAFLPKVRAQRQLFKEVSETGADALRSKNVEYDVLGRGNESRLADMSPGLRDMADRAATSSPHARENITKIAGERQAGMIDRMVDDAQTAFDNVYGEVPNVIKRRAKLEKATAEWADGVDGYGGMREKYKVVPDIFETAPASMRGGPTTTKSGSELLKFFRQPKVKSAVAEARQLTHIGDFPESTHNLSFEELQTIRQQIRRATQLAFKPGGGQPPNGNLGARLEQVEASLTKHMQARMPELKRIDAEYARRKSLERALEEGEDYGGRHSKRALEEKLEQLTKPGREAELREFKYGLASRHLDRLDDIKANRDYASNLLMPSPTERLRMQMAFGPTMSRSVRMNQLEREMALLRGSGAGSQTMRRMASSDAADDVMAAGTTGLSAGPQMATSMAVRGIARGARARANERTARALEPMLMTEGTDAIEEFLKKLRPPIVASGTATKRLPIITGAELVGLLNERKR